MPIKTVAGRSRLGVTVAVLLLFLALSLLLFAGHADWTHGLASTSGGDAWSSFWFLNWWPWAILHGINPLHSAFVYAPAGYDLSWATSVPTAALLTLPVTLLFGADTSFNVLTVLAPGMDGFCAFLLIRACGARTAAALLGGLIFGFSPYEIGQLQGHLNLDLSFCIPLLCLVVVQRVRGRIGPRRFVAGFGALLLAQFGLSAEIFASACFFGVGAWLLFVLLSPPGLRAALLRCGRLAFVPVAAVALLLLPWLLNMRQGAARMPDFINPAWLYSTNLLNLVVPTRFTWPGGAALRPVSASFGGNLSEQGGYLGLPLLAILALLVLDHGRDRRLLALLLLVALLILASLGPSLHVGRWDSRLPLPWWLALHLPLLRGALPVRFSMYAGLGAAVAAALWQSRATTAGGARLRLGALVVATLAVLPNPAAVGWSRMPLLPFFAPERLARTLPGTPTLLVLPYLTTDRGSPTASMLWQWQSGMRFRQTGGFLSFVPFPDNGQRLVQHMMRNEPGRFFPNDIAAYVAGSGTSAIVAGPGTAPALLQALSALRWDTTETGGVTLFRVPPVASLRYAALAGQYWPTNDDRSWIGPEVTVLTHGRTAILHIDAAGLPMPDTAIEVRSDTATTRYMIRAQGSLRIALPADGRFVVSSAHSFRPHLAWGVADPRVLSFLVELEPGA